MRPKIDPAATRAHQIELGIDDTPALVDFIDCGHAMVKLADRIRWDIFEEQWRERFSTAGGPKAKSGRMVAGLLMLKHMEGLSDERLIAAWVCNPYYQYFCGEVHFQHAPPSDPTSLVKWRKQLGEEGMEWLLSTVLVSAVDSGAVNREDFAHVCVDSTVMEKNITYPTDSKLLEKCRVKLVALMDGAGLSIRQRYTRTGPRLAQQVGRFAHAKQFKRMRRALKKQRTIVGRLARELERQLDALDAETRLAAEALLGKVRRIIEQTLNPKATKKLYSLHEPEVDCISKGKAHKRYEFGTKVGIACTQKLGFVVGIRSYPGNPYDGNTLDDLLEQTQILTETPVETIAVDLGYRGRHATKAKIIHRGKKLSRRQKERLRRRSMLEAMIGHMKNDGLLGRCFLAGTDGDAVHAILCGIGHNLRLLMAFLATLPFWLREICLVYLLQAASAPHRVASASPSR